MTNSTKIDFDALFEQRLGRVPTSEDKKAIGLAIISQAESSLGKSGSSDHDSLNALVSNYLAAAQEQYHSDAVDENSVRGIIDTIATAEKDQKQKELTRSNLERRASEDRKRARNRFLGKLGGVATLGAFLGALGGAGLLVYKVGKDPLVASEVAEYEDKKAALEQRFFGPLDHLLEKTVPIVEFTALETKLYSQANLGIDVGEQLNDQNNLLYDQTTDGVRVIAKKVEVEEGAITKGLLLLLKVIDQKVTAAYTYETCHPCNPLAKAVSDADDALMSIRFNRDYLLVVDHNNKVVKKLVGRTGELAYKGGENIEVYRGNTLEVLTEFRTLYNRGPNPNAGAE